MCVRSTVVVSSMVGKLPERNAQQENEKGRQKFLHDIVLFDACIVHCIKWSTHVNHRAIFKNVHESACVLKPVLASFYFLK